MDASVEIVSGGGSVTGRRFFIQLKATDEPSVRRALRVRLKIGTFRYLQSFESPVLLVVCHAPTARIYARWVHDLDVFYATRSGTHLKFRFDAADELRASDAGAKLEADVNDWRWLHSPTLTTPIVFHLKPATQQILGASMSEVVLRLDSLSRPLNGMVEIRQAPPGKIRGDIVVLASDIHVRLFGGAAAAIHRSLKHAMKAGPPRQPRQPRRDTDAERDSCTHEHAAEPGSVAADILAAIALTFRHGEHLSEAAAVAEIAFGQATVSRNAGAAALMMQTLIAARRFEAALRASITFWKEGHPQLAQFVVLCVLLTSPKAEERSELLAGLDDWLNTVALTAPPDVMSATCYNVGRYVGTPGWDLRRGLHLMLTAARLDPTYRTRGYFWEELGAILFHLDRFLWSARCYERAGALGRESTVYAKAADGLWRLGRFREAQAAMEKYDGTEAYWLLLSLAIETVGGVAGVPSQHRLSDRAVDLVERGLSPDLSEVARKECLMEAIQADALKNAAWFNLGVHYGRAGAADDAAFAFLVAALIRPNDVESWANAFVASKMWAEKTPEDKRALAVLSLIVTAGIESDREGLFRAVADRLPPEDNAARENLSRFFAAFPERKGPSPVLRIVGGTDVLEVPVEDPTAAFRILMDIESSR